MMMQALNLSVVRGQERAVTVGHDHTCRVWKVAEESQLIFRAHAPALDTVAYVTGTEWLSGGADGSLALWRRVRGLCSRFLPQNSWHGA